MRSAILIVLTATLLAACDPPPPRSRTVEDFLAEPAEMQGVLERCNQNEHMAKTDIECVNAKMAFEHSARGEDAKLEQERQAQFEKSREQIRRREAERQAAEERAKPTFDPYTSPVTLDTPPPSKP